MKTSFKTEFISLLTIAATIVAAFYFYSIFPARVPTHWNLAGEPNGWSSRGVGAFAIPVLLIGMYFLFLLLPRLDPKKENYVQFARAYNIFRSLIILFMAVIYFVASLNVLGYNISVGLWTPVLVGVLCVIIGNYLSKVKMNWFMGIRTPWTLSSEEVWNKTHRVGSKMFILGGILIALTAVLPITYKLIVFIAALAIIILGTVGYSYFVYLQENKK